MSTFAELTIAGVANAVSGKTPGDPTAAYAEVLSPYSADQAAATGPNYSTTSILGTASGVNSIPLIADATHNYGTFLLGTRTIVGCWHYLSVGATSITFRLPTGAVQTIALADMSETPGYERSSNGKWLKARNDVCVAHLAEDAPSAVLAGPLKILDSDYPSYADLANSPVMYCQHKLPSDPPAYWTLAKCTWLSSASYPDQTTVNHSLRLAADVTYADWRRPDYLLAEGEFHNTPPQSGTPVVAVVKGQIIAIGHLAYGGATSYGVAFLSDVLDDLLVLGYGTDIEDSYYRDAEVVNPVNYAITATVKGTTETTLCVWQEGYSGWLGARADGYIPFLSSDGSIGTLFIYSANEMDEMHATVTMDGASGVVSDIWAIGGGDPFAVSNGEIEPLPIAVAANGTLTGAATGLKGVVGRWCVELDGTLPAGTLTLSDGGSGGTFTPSSIILDNQTAAFFWYTPAATGVTNLVATATASYAGVTMTGPLEVTVTDPVADENSTRSAATVLVTLTIQGYIETVSLPYVAELSYYSGTSAAGHAVVLDAFGVSSELYVTNDPSLDSYMSVVVLFDGMNGEASGPWAATGTIILEVSGGTIEPSLEAMTLTSEPSGANRVWTSEVVTGVVLYRYSLDSGDWTLTDDDGATPSVTVTDGANTSHQISFRGHRGDGRIVAEGTGRWVINNNVVALLISVGVI